MGKSNFSLCTCSTGCSILVPDYAVLVLDCFLFLQGAQVEIEAVAVTGDIIDQ